MMKVGELHGGKYLVGVGRKTLEGLAIHLISCARGAGHQF